MNWETILMVPRFLSAQIINNFIALVYFWAYLVLFVYINFRQKSRNLYLAIVIWFDIMIFASDFKIILIIEYGFHGWWIINVPCSSATKIYLSIHYKNPEQTLELQRCPTHTSSHFFKFRPLNEYQFWNGYCCGLLTKVLWSRQLIQSTICLKAIWFWFCHAKNVHKIEWYRLSLVLFQKYDIFKRGFQNT